MRTAVQRTAIAAGVLVIFLAASSGPARAGESLESKWRSACWADAISFCTLQAITNNRPGVRDCLVRDIDRISRACRSVIHQADREGTPDTRVREEPMSAEAGAPSPH